MTAATLTCDACLEGRHRRTCGCACSVCARRAPATTRKATTPKPRRATPTPRHRAPKGPDPRLVYDGATRAERKAQHMRRARARARAAAGRPLTVSDVLASPEFAAEVRRLESIIHG